jgi:septal ring factor EnvC (AmiA/AmiB activator)
MQSKIKESLESVERAKNQVNHILIKLKSMEKENTDRINSLDEEINNLITKA